MGNDSSARSFLSRVLAKNRTIQIDRRNSARFAEINRAANRALAGKDRANPVLIFNASTRLDRTSLNAAFGWLTGSSLKLAGIPVTFLACAKGLYPCLLGTNIEDASAALPCERCMKLSQEMYREAEVLSLDYRSDPTVFNDAEGLDLEGLEVYSRDGVPLGELTLPSLRWIMRRHHLENAPAAVRLYRMYIRSAWSVYVQVERWVRENNPRAIVVFNGQQYPEAVVKWIGKRAGIPTFTHEIGLMPETAIFTEGEATACPIFIPPDFRMTPERDDRLDAYLEARMKGVFKTAGVQFWPEMEGLTPAFWNMARSFRQVVPIFTNVVFDTSQKHANVVFDDMFQWLDSVKEIIEKHVNTLFVIRAHPDEIRKGKESAETVTEWVLKNHVSLLHNVLFIGPDQFISSYDLIRIAKFVMIYNSTIGLEAAAMGALVVSGGASRFTPYPISEFPDSRELYAETIDRYLNATEISVPELYRETARKFMYYQFFHVALPFRSFIEPDPVWRGYVQIRKFGADALLPENNASLRVIHDGILRNGDFTLPADDDMAAESDPQRGSSDGVFNEPADHIATVGDGGTGE